MTALELHRQHPSLELAPILRVIKYMGFDSNSLSDAEVDKILHLYPQFERDPELVVGIEAVCRLTDLEPDRLVEILGTHRHEIPFLGTTAHPMVPASAIDMIRAIANGDDPLSARNERLFTLTEMAERTDISLASLSKYVKKHPDRIPSKLVGKMRKFPRAAIPVFQQIKTENLGRRTNGHDRVERQKAAINRRYAGKFAELESQLDTALEVSKELTRSLNRLMTQVRRARTTAESAAKISKSDRPKRARRSGGGHRPDTIVAACKKVLADADGPMRVADITERVIGMGTPINAKNPNVTVSSILSSYDDFGRVRRGYYELLDRDGADGRTAATEEPASGTEAKGRSEAADQTEREDPALIDRNPREVLAGLQAAADSEDRAAEARKQDADPTELDLEPSGAAG